MRKTNHDNELVGVVKVIITATFWIKEEILEFYLYIFFLLFFWIIKDSGTFTILLYKKSLDAVINFIHFLVLPTDV